MTVEQAIGLTVLLAFTFILGAFVGWFFSTTDEF